MKNRKSKVEKEHGSDDEDETFEVEPVGDSPSKSEQNRAENNDMAVEPIITSEEIARQELDSAETIPESEVSPAAFLFKNHDDQDDLNIYEEK